MPNKYDIVETIRSVSFEEAVKSASHGSRAIGHVEASVVASAEPNGDDVEEKRAGLGRAPSQTLKPGPGPENPTCGNCVATYARKDLLPCSCGHLSQQFQGRPFQEVLQR